MPFPASLYSALLVALVLGHGYSLWRRGRWMFPDPITTFYAGVVIVHVRQPLQYWQLFQDWHGPGILEKALFWCLVALAAVVIGYELPFGIRLARRLPRPAARLVPGKLFATGVTLVVLGVLGYVYLADSAGGFSAWLAVGRGATDWKRVSAYVAVLIVMLPLGVTVLLFHAELHRVNALRRIAIWSAGALTLLWFLYLGTRTGVILMSLSMTSAWYLPRRKSAPLLLAAVLGVSLLFTVELQGSFRHKFTNLRFNLDEDDLSEAANNLLPEDPYRTGPTKPGAAKGAEFNCIMAAVELVPDAIDYQYGYGHLEVFTRPIPRAVWADKSYPMSESYTPILRTAGLSTAEVATSDKRLLMGPAFTYVGHWWVQGGPFGIIVMSVLTGVFLRMVRGYLDVNAGNEGVVLIFSQLITLGFSEAASTPLQWVFTMPFIVPPLALLVYLSRARSVRPRVARAAIGPGGAVALAARRAAGAQPMRATEQRANAD